MRAKRCKRPTAHVPAPEQGENANQALKIKNGINKLVNDTLKLAMSDLNSSLTSTTLNKLPVTSAHTMTIADSQ